MDVTWYDTFFNNPIVLDLWRRAVSPEQTRAEVDFVERALGLRPGARVLDVACGAGRHSLALAARDYRLTGVDISTESVSEARARAAHARLTVEWRNADMRDLPWEAEFDAAYCFGNSFGYLEPDGSREFVHALARTLKPAARFALDTGNAAESILPNLREREETQVDDITFIEESRYLAEHSCLETTYSFVRRGVTEYSQTGLHWVYTVRELCALLGDAGLAVRHLYGGLDAEPFTVGSRYLVLVAERT